MENIFKELEKFGLDNISDVDLYEKKQPIMVDTPKPKIKTEKDYIFKKSFCCPICYSNFQAKVLKSKTAKYIGQDFDCKPNYNIEILKYNVVMCPNCGYSNIVNDFQNITKKQKELFKEKMKSFISNPYNDEICTNEEALVKFKMALATAMATKANYSKKAFICLQLAWLYRSFGKTTNDKNIKEKYFNYQKYFYRQAYEGYTYALQLERPPLSHWSEDKFYYIYACLACVNNNTRLALKLISEIVLAKSTSKELKNKARALRDLIKERE